MFDRDTRSKTGRTKRKPANSPSTTKALVNKADQVRRQALKRGLSVREPGKEVGANEGLSSNGPGRTPEVLRTAMNENLRPSLSDVTQAFGLLVTDGASTATNTFGVNGVECHSVPAPVGSILATRAIAGVMLLQSAVGIGGKAFGLRSASNVRLSI